MRKGKIKLASDMWFILLAEQLIVIKNTVFFYTTNMPTKNQIETTQILCIYNQNVTYSDKF